MLTYKGGFPGDTVKNLPANEENTGDASSIPGLGRSLGGGNDNSSIYSCLGNPWTEELVGYSSWGCKELDMTGGLCSHTCNLQG